VKFILALNALNTPWVAVVVIVLGMCFDLLSKKFGVPNDAATGVIGAGIGLLTGQAINAAHRAAETPTQQNPTN
jgi:hypothetical protein